MPTVREYEQTLQREPGQAEAYLALRKLYREAGRFDKLVTLYETRAQAIEDSAKAAELFYLAAEVRIDHLSDVAGAEADLAHAVSRDAGHTKATQRLKDIYRQQSRLAEYMTMMEMEAAALAKGKDANGPRLDELRVELNQFSNNHLVPLERALATPARRHEVTAEQLKLIESARKIHRALGDYPQVVRLYELELAATTDPKRRADLLFGLGRVLGEKVGDLDGAAQRLGEVVRLRPRDDKALEALASVYANPQWHSADGRERAAALYHQVARRRHEAGDTDNAVAALRKALAAAPGHAEASELIEQLLYESRKLQDLDRYYRERVAGAHSNEERMDFLFKRAQLAEGDLGDPPEAVRIYEEIVAIEPSGGPASQHLGQLYQNGRDYPKLAALREKQLEAAKDRGFRGKLLQELASLYKDRLGDKEQAAVYLHAILQEDPGNAEAAQAYADHFRQRGDWRELVDLLEFTIEHLQATGTPVEQLLPRLEEVATIAESKLNDGDRAFAAWQRIQELNPGHGRAHEAQKRILQKTRQWDKMAVLLEREAREADPAQKIELLRRLARLWIEKLGAADRAAAVYQEILGLDPRDMVALRALTEAFERGERWQDLAKLLRGQLELVTTKQEKLTLLRRLLVLYDERLAQATEGNWAATEILKLVPGDRDALARLEAILDRLDDKTQLVEILEYHVKYAATSEEKGRLVRRIADLLQNKLGEYERAAGYWEQLVRLVPGDSTALEALAAAYERLGRAEDLARILEAMIQRSAGDATAQVECLRRLARVTGATLKQPARAQRAWEELSKALPTDREALAALSEIYETKGDWKTLVGILERRIPLAEDPGFAVAMAMDRARIFEEHLRNPDEAMKALEQIVTELDPRNLGAFERLRRVAEAKQDWPRVVSVAERQLFLAEDPHERAAGGLDVGLLWRDKLKDPKKAMAAFERVIEIEPANLEALHALAPLYAAASEWERLVFTDERLLEQAEEPGERRRLMFEIAQTYERGLREPRRSFEWYRRAYVESPDEPALSQLEEVAEAHGLWEELIQVYAGEGARSTDPGEQVEVSLKVAGLCEQRLRSPARAFMVLRDALPSEPAGTRFLPELERLAGDTRDWAGLLDVYNRVARGRPGTEERVDLLRRRAAVREEKMKDASGAMDEFLRSFALDLGNADTQREILRLAEATSRWEDALGVQAQLFGRAAMIEEKVEVARRAAALVEEKVRDRVRAFRAYLNAFRLAPENEGIVANLWRLAALIGRYQSAPAPAVTDEDVEELEELQDVEEHEVEEQDVEEMQLTPPPTTSTPRPMLPPRPAVGFETPWHELSQAYESLPAADNATRQRYLKRVAEIWERGAQDIDRALEAMERAFQLEPGDEEARETMRRIAAEHDRWDDICGIYLRAVDTASREDAVALQHDVARIREQLGQLDQAEERYRAVVQLQPDDGAALDRLEHLYRMQERWAELTGVLERRATAPADQPVPAEARRKAFELAELYEKRLDRPYEAIDTLERAVVEEEEERGPDQVREACASYEALVRLYGRVGLWQKAVTALQRQIELTADPAALRELRWRLGEIHERELNQVDQALEAYESILAAAPKDAAALAALDRMLSAYGRYEALQEVLGRRAELAQGPERIELIRRRATILEEKLDNPDAAAGCLRALGADALGDDETSAALLRNLRGAGLAHEALRVITQRIEVLGKAGGDARKRVNLYLELSNLKSVQLGDPAGAKEAIDHALALVPEDTEALAALAKLHLKQNEFRAYAETRLRQAKALAGTDAGAAALLEAGAVFRDQVGDAAQAKTAFELAVEEYPAHPEALHALGTLLVADGQLPEGRALFERQLELVDAPVEKAAVLTDIARATWEKPGDAPEAIRRLDEALELAPDHLPALLTMADVYYKEHQWEQAERRLSQSLRRMRSQPEQAARLSHRLAEVYDKLGRIEDAYRQLTETDRLAPGQLPVRIAMAENRFRGRKWREAVAHLEGIASHADAAAYKDDVAQALALGAQAEVKLKRPERAVALYEAALRLVPDHRPSLKELAELALERGDKHEAAQYLRRVAEASTDKSQRASLFEQLGDLHESLEDDTAARAAYEAAVAALDPPTEAHVNLLEKTLRLERAAKATREATETAMRIAELVSGPEERATRRREVAALMAEQGDTVRAADLLGKALVDNPADEEVLAAVCELFETTDREDELEELLARVLPTLPPPADRPAARERRAGLWERLGNLRRKEAAMAAYEKAVEAQPDRVPTRVALAKLYGDRAEHAEAAQRNRRLLVQADITQAESLRALARTYAADGHIDRAHCCYEVLDVLGLTDKKDRAFLAKYPAQELKADDPYAGSVEDGDRGKYLAHPEARVLAEVFASIYEGVSGLGTVTLESLGVGAQDKVSPISELDIGKIYGQTAKALGNRRTNLYVNYDPKFTGVELILAPPTAIVIDQRLATEALAAEVRFRLGRALELTRIEYILGATMPAKKFAQLFSNVLKAFHPRHARWRAGAEGVEEAAKLKKALPYKVSKRLAELFQENEETPFSSARWRAVVFETGDRAGLLACGDLRTAARLVLAGDGTDPGAELSSETAREHAQKAGPFRELLRFALSEEYFALRACLGTAVTRAAAA